MKVFHVRTEKKIKLVDAVSFKAGERILLEQAEAGDIIGLHNHGTIKIGDTFTSGEELQFTGIPNFAPELFRKIRLRDPIKSKQLKKGLAQLAEEGSTQVFVPLDGGDSVVGAIGQLQFDMVSYRLREEYQVEAVYEPVNIFTARWVNSKDEKMILEFRKKYLPSYSLIVEDTWLIWLLLEQIFLLSKSDGQIWNLVLREKIKSNASSKAKICFSMLLGVVIGANRLTLEPV